MPGHFTSCGSWIHSHKYDITKGVTIRALLAMNNVILQVHGFHTQFARQQK